MKSKEVDYFNQMIKAKQKKQTKLPEIKEPDLLLLVLYGLVVAGHDQWPPTKLLAIPPPPLLVVCSPMEAKNSPLCLKMMVTSVFELEEEEATKE